MSLIYNGKKYFHNTPLDFRIFADFEADNETDNSSIGISQLSFVNKIRYVLDIIYYLT